MKSITLALFIVLCLLCLTTTALFAQSETTLAVGIEPLTPAAQSAIAGETITFLITITNTGTVDAHHPTLTDNIFNPVPTGAWLVDFALVRGGNNFAYAVQGGECTDSGFCNLPDLPAGGFIIAQVTVQIAADQGNGEDLDQHVCIQADNAQQSCTNHKLDILSQATVALHTRSLFEPLAIGAAGGDEVYILSIQNQGPSTAAHTIITHTLPPGVTVATTPTVAGAYATPIACVGNQSAVLVCQVAQLPAGATIEIYVPAEVSDPLPYCGGHLTAQTLLSYQDDSHGRQTVQAAVTNQVVCHATLAVQQTGPALIPFGATYRYVITVPNTSATPMAVNGLTLLDALPATVRFDGATNVSAINLADCGFSGGPTRWTNTNALAAGASCALAIQVQAKAEAALCQNGLIINPTTATRSAPSAATAQALTITQVQCQADLAITQQGPATIIPGAQSVVTFTVTNNGPDPACGVEVQALPQQVSAIVVDVGGETSQYNSSGLFLRRLSCLDRAGGDQQDTLRLTYAMPSETTAHALRHCVVVAGTTADPHPANNTPACLSIPVQPQADLRLEQSTLTPVVAPSSAALLRIEVSNAGPSAVTAPNASFAVTHQIQGLPNGVISAIGGAGCQITAPAAVTCVPLTLAKGERRVIFITVQTPEAATPNSVFTSCAAIVQMTGVTDGNLTQNGPVCTQVQLVERGADLRVTKFVQPSSFVRAGEIFTFTTLVDNLGPTAALTLTLTDTVQAGGTFQVIAVQEDHQADCSTPPTGQIRGATLTCALHTPLPAGELWSITIIATAFEDMEVYSRAVAFSRAPSDPDLNNNVDDTLLQVGEVADLDLRVTTPLTSALTPSQQFIYTINVGNAGPSPAANVVVQSTLPLGLHVTALPSFCAATQSTTAHITLTCHLGGLEVGLAETFSVGVVVTAQATPGLFFLPIAVTSDAYDATTRNNTTHIAAQIAARTNLHTQITATQLTPTPGALINLTLAVTNAGPAVAAQVLLTYTLPPGLTALAVDPACSLAGSCWLADLAPGQRAAINLTALVGRAAACATALAVDATVQTATYDENPFDNAARLTLTPLCTVDLRLLQLEQPSTTLLIGQRFTRTLVVDNLGPGYAHAVVVDAELTAAAAFTLETVHADAGGNRPDAQCALLPSSQPIPAVGQRFTLRCRLDQPLEPVQMPTAAVQAATGEQLAAPAAGGGRWLIQISMSAARPLQVNSIVDVSSRDGETNPADNVQRDQQGIACTTSGNADLALNVQFAGAQANHTPPTVVTGSTITFTLQAANYTKAAVCAQLVEVVPVHTTFNAAVATPGWNCAHGAPPGTVCTYALYVIPGTATQAVQFAVTVDTFITGGERTTNLVELKDGGLDLNRTNNVVAVDF